MRKTVTYKGPALEKGGTSIFCKSPAPGVDFLINEGVFFKNAKILDYGAGKCARNTNYLISKGFDTVAVDKFNFNDKFNVLQDKDIDGQHFDIAFTSYVLNVVTYNDECKILKKLDSISDIQCHITRNSDLVKILDKAQKNKGFTYEWILNNGVGAGFGSEFNEFKNGRATKEFLTTLARFGFATVKGFQRLPMLDKGYETIIHGSYKIYIQNKSIRT